VTAPHHAQRLLERRGAGHRPPRWRFCLLTWHKLHATAAALGAALPRDTLLPSSGHRM